MIDLIFLTALSAVSSKFLACPCSFDLGNFLSVFDRIDPHRKSSRYVVGKYDSSPPRSTRVLQARNPTVKTGPLCRFVPPSPSIPCHFKACSEGKKSFAPSAIPSLLLQSYIRLAMAYHSQLRKYQFSQTYIHKPALGIAVAHVALDG